jgi:hypothetical protein
VLTRYKTAFLFGGGEAGIFKQTKRIMQYKTSMFPPFVCNRSAIEAREEKRVLSAMPRGPPVDSECLLEGLKTTRFNPPRTNFGQPPLPPIQESVGRGEAAERAFFNRLTKETRLAVNPLLPCRSFPPFEISLDGPPRKNLARMTLPLIEKGFDR